MKVHLLKNSALILAAAGVLVIGARPQPTHAEPIATGDHPPSPSETDQPSVGESPPPQPAPPASPAPEDEIRPSSNFDALLEQNRLIQHVIDSGGSSRPKILYTAPQFVDEVSSQVGRVFLPAADPADGYMEIPGPPHETFGLHVRSVGDANGDGHADYEITGAFRDTRWNVFVRHSVLSGRTGEVLSRTPLDEIGPPLLLAGDLNLDGVVDTSDLSMLLTRLSSPVDSMLEGDLDFDGRVTRADLEHLLGNFGATTDSVRAAENDRHPIPTPPNSNDARDGADERGYPPIGCSVPDWADPCLQWGLMCIAYQICCDLLQSCDSEDGGGGDDNIDPSGPGDRDGLGVDDDGGKSGGGGPSPIPPGDDGGGDGDGEGLSCDDVNVEFTLEPGSQFQGEDGPRTLIFTEPETFNDGGNEITLPNAHLAAAGAPGDGEYSWSFSGPDAEWAGDGPPDDQPVAGLIIHEPGDYTVTVTYTVEINGMICSDSATSEFEAAPFGLTLFRPEVIDPAQSAIDDEDELSVGAQTFVNLDNDDQDGLFDSNGTSQDPDDTMVEGEDELIRVRLALPDLLTEGQVMLDVPVGAGNIRTWRANNKDMEFDPSQALTVPDDFDAEGDELVRDLWVEGVSPHAQQQGTRLKMSYTHPDGQVADEAAVTIIGVDGVEWKGQGNAHDDSDLLDADPNWPAGLSPGSKRVFPGARFAGGAVEPTPRNTVTVKVALTVEPVEPVDLYLRSFDVDDPTDDQAPVDDEGADEDNRGTSPARRGMLDGADAHGIASLTFNSASEAEIDFQTTMQPGDNFRIVANGDRDFLLDLHNDDNQLGPHNADKQRIVNTHVLGGQGAPPPTPQQAEIRQPGKYASDVLTVWRMLHLELDSMGPVSGNYVEGNITSLNTGDSDTATQATVTLDAPPPGAIAGDLDDGSPRLDGPTIGNGRFEGGTLTVAGVHDIDMLDGNGSDFVRRMAGLDICADPLPFVATPTLGAGKKGPPAPLSGAVTRISNGQTLHLNVAPGALTPDFIGRTIQIGSGQLGPVMEITAINAPDSEVTVNTLRVPFRGVDDDSPNGTAIPKPDTSRMTDAFMPAYVLPREGVLPGDETLPFMANVQTLNPGGIGAYAIGWNFTNSGLRSPRFWVVYVRGGFQDDTRDADFDPDHETLGTFGIAAIELVPPGASLGGINVYWEAHNEALGSSPPNMPGRGYLMVDTVVHEVGHLFGCLHSDRGVMGDDPRFDSIDFAPISLDRIRSRVLP